MLILIALKIFLISGILVPVYLKMTQIQPNYESGSPRRPSMTSDYNEDIFDEVIEEYSEVYYIKP